MNSENKDMIMSEEAKEIKTTEAAPDVSEDSDEKVSEEGAAPPQMRRRHPPSKPMRKPKLRLKAKSPSRMKLWK